MAEAFAKFRVGTAGAGAAHASYITRASALDPHFTGDRAGQPEIRGDQISATTALDQELNNHELDRTHSADNADPVWTWNAPSYLTGDYYGLEGNKSSRIAERVSQQDRVVYAKMTEAIKSPDRARRIQAKSSKLRAYFGSKEQFEKAKGGRTHYRVILSFDVPASNSEIRDLTNQFLKDTFPKAIGFAAIHRDTEHPHVHIYLHARQVDGRKIYLAKNEYTAIDEKWAKIYSEFAGERSIYVQHLHKKEETRQWKIAAAEAFRKGTPIPPKPERDSDRRERLAEQRLSAQRSEGRDRGKQLSARPAAEPVMRPGSEKETARLLAKEEVAREQLAHLIRTDAPEKEVKWAAITAQELGAALDKTFDTRKEMGKERMPQVVYTTREWQQLKGCQASRDLSVKDDRSAARVQSAQVIAGAELKDAQGKADAFQGSRHFWKFEVEGWDKGLSLKEVEQAIKTKSEERLKLYNFLRPSRREAIGGQIDYLEGVKRDVQKQLVAKESAVNKNLGAAQIRYEAAAKQVEHSSQLRTIDGKKMPPPIFHNEELAKMEAIATRNRDGQMLTFVYRQVRDRVLRNPSPEALSRAKGRSVMAKMEMLKEAERFVAAARFSDFRQLPRKDERGLDQTKSVREVSSKNALETIIRHFTDSPERKKEAGELTDLATQQVKRAEAMSIKAKDYSVAVDQILNDFCRAAGVSAKQVAPALNAEEIGHLRDFADRLSVFSSNRKEFIEAARSAEQRLDNLEAMRLSREARSEHAVSRPEKQTRRESIVSNQRTDRDSGWRGR